MSLLEQQLEMLDTVLDVPFVRRVRRNHGLEHATITLLSRKIYNLKMAGRSDARGFWLVGEADEAEVRAAVGAALERMRGGEHKLAIHPNCGTNLVTVAVLGTAATLVSLAGSNREKHGMFTRVPVLMTGLMVAALAGQPLGMRVQEHVTTLGDPGDLEVVSIQRRERGGMTAFRVETRSS